MKVTAELMIKIDELITGKINAIDQLQHDDAIELVELIQYLYKDYSVTMTTENNVKYAVMNRSAKE